MNADQRPSERHQHRQHHKLGHGLPFAAVSRILFTVAQRPQPKWRARVYHYPDLQGHSMKDIAIGIAVFAVLVGTPVLAADMPLKAPPPAPTYNWTGFYIGGNVGYGWTDPTVTFMPNDVASQGFICDSFGLPAGHFFQPWRPRRPAGRL
jgi:hypothetical protein